MTFFEKYPKIQFLFLICFFFDYLIGKGFNKIQELSLNYIKKIGVKSWKKIN